MTHKITCETIFYRKINMNINQFLYCKIKNLTSNFALSRQIDLNNVHVYLSIKKFVSHVFLHVISNYDLTNLPAI